MTKKLDFSGFLFLFAKKIRNLFQKVIDRIVTFLYTICNRFVTIRRKRFGGESNGHR